MSTAFRFTHAGIAASLVLSCAIAAAQTAGPALPEKPAAGTNPPAEDRGSAGAVVQEPKAPLPSVETPSRAAAEPAPAGIVPPAQPTTKPSRKLRRIDGEIKRGTDSRV